MAIMKTDNRFFEELAKMATGAVGAFSGIREQIQTEIKTQINRFIVEMDFVPREDFEIVEAMAREARMQNIKLEARLAELEQYTGLKKKSAATKKTEAKPKKTAPKKAAVKKPAPKKKKK